jgi:hypothetical protein
MAAPVADKIITPLDTGNTGKKVRTQTRTVGSDSVHEHFFIPISQYSKVGIYFADTGTLSVQASATNGTTTGFFWLFNPVGAAIKGALRRMECESNITSATAMLTIPRIAISRFTFTGTASGAQITPANRDSTDATAVVNLRTASTGLTVTLGAIAHVFYPLIGQGVGTSGVPSTRAEWEPQLEEAFSVMRAGEGFVGWQPDAGTAADTRRFHCCIGWEERE